MRHTAAPVPVEEKFVEVRVLDAIPASTDAEEAGKLFSRTWTFHLESTESPGTRWVITRPDDFSARGFRHAFETHVPVRIPEIELKRDAKGVEL
jgi:hypothetical protein